MYIPIHDSRNRLWSEKNYLETVVVVPDILLGKNRSDCSLSEILSITNQLSNKEFIWFEPDKCLAWAEACQKDLLKDKSEVEYDKTGGRGGVALKFQTP